MDKITGVASGGLMGSHPLDPTTWSGSSKALFENINRLGQTHNNVGAEISHLEYFLRLIPHFYPDKEVWQRRLMMNVGYRNSLTQSLQKYAKQNVVSKNILQLGAYCNSKEVFPNSRVFSYQDGNVLQKFQSDTLHPKLRDDKRLFESVFNYEKKLAADVDLLLTTSEFLRESFIDGYGVPSDKVVNVNIGVNLSEYPSALAAIKDYASPHLLFIAKARFYLKGADIALEAFSNILNYYPSATLHIVGQKEIPKEFKHINNVLNHGVLNKENPEDNAKLKSIFEKSCILLMPSRFEPFGIAPIEAMLHKIPPIVTGEWALKHTVNDGKTGLHARLNDVDDWTEQILKLLQRPELIQQLGENGRKVALEQFTWEGVAKRIIDLFQTY